MEGKFFRLDGRKFAVKGVTYGPFAPNSDGALFASREQTQRDFAQLQGLGANVLRIYHVPPVWFMDLALEAGLRLLVDVPWNKHLCFLDSRATEEAALSAIREAAVAAPIILQFLP